MNLIELQPTIFLDPAALSFVRFENLDDEPLATIRFQDGGAEILKGDAALQLHLKLRNVNDLNEMPTIETRSKVDQSGWSDSPVIETSERTIKLKALTVNAWSPQRNKAWYYRKDDDGREYFHAFVNAKGSCSVRSFDVHTGVFLGKQYEAGNYQDRFSDLLTNGEKVTVKNQPNLERDCKERLPEPTLAYLRAQIRAL